MVIVSFPHGVSGRHNEMPSRVLNLKRLGENRIEVSTLLGEVLGSTKFDFEEYMFDALKACAHLHDIACPEHQNAFLKFCVESTFVDEKSWKVEANLLMPWRPDPRAPSEVGDGEINMKSSAGRRGKQPGKKPKTPSVKKASGKPKADKQSAKSAAKKKPAARVKK